MKIAMLLSGGVDSSVSLALLKKQGFDVTAFYLKIWLEDELSFLGNCPWQEDLDFVQQVCAQLHVPLEVINFQHIYQEKIISYVVSEVKEGRTPNPDVLCNKHIKFGAFFDSIGTNFDKVASGHYAHVEEKNQKYFLKSAPDPIKDQTYFLSQLSQNQLVRLMCPIGNFAKKEVRQLAKNFDLPNQHRPDSQGICFLGKIKFKEFLKSHLGIQKGDLIEVETGKKMGEHEGYWFYTIGQRQGIKLGGGPWFVVKKDTENNIIFISKSYYEIDKKRTDFYVTHINWIPENPEIQDIQVKLRHGPQRHDALLTKINEQNYTVRLFNNDQGIAAGQFAVFYQNNYCLGGGRIT